MLRLSPVGDVASAVENASAAYSATTAAPHEYFDYTGQRATAVPTATPSHALSKDRKLGGSSRSQRWAGSIIGTNVAPLERTDGVESQQQTTNYSIAIPGAGRFFSPAQAEPIPQTQTDNNFGSLIRVCVDERRSPQDPAGCVC